MKEPKGYYNCAGCQWWKRLTGATYACHYMHDTGERCPRQGDKCLAKKIGKKVNNKGAFNKDNVSSLYNGKWKGET